jgi:DNA-directed RNA polymerase specialized sigma24 family protein
MGQRRDAQSRLWIPDSDSEGNPLSPILAEAGTRVWDRARRIVVRYLGDDEEAAEILEGVVAGAARSQVEIRNVDAYLLTAVAREAVRRHRRRRLIKFVDPSDLHELAVSVTHESAEDRFDEKRRLDLFCASLDPKGLEMFERRALKQGWRQIAVELGYASAHSAEVQFRK